MENKYKLWKQKVSHVKSKQYSKQEIEYWFGNIINFGTAGLRGKMEQGPNGINNITVANAANSFALYLLKEHQDDSLKYGIIIAHDNRNNGKEFSLLMAKILGHHKIPVKLFNNNDLASTPLLSYLIAQNNYVGGINITASHNPAEYNGIKLYDNDGKQLDSNHTALISKTFKKNIDIFLYKTDDQYITYFEPDIQKEYLERIIELSNASTYQDVSLVFTPQHGTATSIAKPLFEKLKVNYLMVKEQTTIDPLFSNTKSPNPQDQEAFILAKEYGDKNNIDLLFSTDPDADRFAVVVKHNNQWVHLSGNELPIIQIYNKLQKPPSKNIFVVKSIVTSNYVNVFKEKYDFNIFESLTGFKNIIKVLLEQEQKGGSCLIAYEESSGSTLYSVTRDKDAFQALINVIQIYDELKNQDKTLVDYLNEIKEEFGYFISNQVVKKVDLINNPNGVKEFMKRFNSYKVNDLLGALKITNIVDFNLGYQNFEKSNLIMIEFDNSNRIIIRPSGTEPMIRIYVDLFNKDEKILKSVYDKLIKAL